MTDSTVSMGNIMTLQVPTSLDELATITEEKKDFLQVWIDELPGKALNLGIRVAFTLLFFLIGLFLIKLVRSLASKGLEKAGLDKGVIQFIDSCIKLLLMTMLILTIAINYGFDAASVVAVLGSAGIAVGLSLQGALSNFAGGILILLLKPFKVGDYIIEDSKGNEGVVTEINIFYTQLTTVDNKVVVVPNGSLASSSLTNVTRMPKRQLDLRVGISYTADLKKAREVAEKTVKNNSFILQEEPVRIFVHELGDSAVILGIRAWTLTENYWNARWEINEQIKLDFDAEDIEIPFNQVEVHMR